MQKTISYFLILFVFFGLSSCNTYQKALKSDDIKLKYDLAEQYYNAEDYRRAKNLFEQLQPKYRGKPQAERITFFYANCLFQTKSYISSAYEFESFTKAYPKSQKLEEAYYMMALSYSKVSPVFSLDQKDTYEALNKLQEYINRYPESERLEEANNLVQGLREKTEHKAFEIAKQYHKIRDYKAAIKAIDNFIGDNPGTPYREEAMVVQFQSASILALNSVYRKKEERLKAAKNYYKEFKRAYPESSFLEDCDKLFDEVDKEITTFAVK
jgi:outer membrane protein assembly factor BamD